MRPRARARSPLPNVNAVGAEEEHEDLASPEEKPARVRMALFVSAICIMTGLCLQMQKSLMSRQILSMNQRHQHDDQAALMELILQQDSSYYRIQGRINTIIDCVVRIFFEPHSLEPHGEIVITHTDIQLTSRVKYARYFNVFVAFSVFLCSCYKWTPENAKGAKKQGNQTWVSGKNIKEHHMAIAKATPFVLFARNSDNMTIIMFFMFQAKQFLVDIYGSDSASAYSSISTMYIFTLMLWYVDRINPRANGRLWLETFFIFTFCAVIALMVYCVPYLILSVYFLSNESMAGGFFSSVTTQGGWVIGDDFSNITHNTTQFSEDWRSFHKTNEEFADRVMYTLKELVFTFLWSTRFAVVICVTLYLWRCFFIGAGEQAQSDTVWIFRDLEIFVSVCDTESLDLAHQAYKNGEDVTRLSKFHKSVAFAISKKFLRASIIYVLLCVQDSDVHLLGHSQCDGFQSLVWISYAYCVWQYYADLVKYYAYSKQPDEVYHSLKDDDASTYQNFTFYQENGSTTWTLTGLFFTLAASDVVSYAVQVIYQMFYVLDWEKENILDKSLSTVIFHMTASDHLEKHIPIILYALLCSLVFACLCSDLQVYTIKSSHIDVCNVSRKTIDVIATKNNASK